MGKQEELRVRDRPAKGHKEDRDESVTRILEADDKLIGEGGGEGVLGKIRREVGEL